MKRHVLPICLALVFGAVGFGLVSGCDSGEKVVDEVTGNRAVKQYHKSKKDIEQVVDQQTRRLEQIPGDED